MRASFAIEKSGVPTVSVIATGFERQGRAIAAAMGFRDFRLAGYPGVIMNDSAETLREKVRENTLRSVIEGLSRGRA